MVYSGGCASVVSENIPPKGPHFDGVRGDIRSVAVPGPTPFQCPPESHRPVCLVTFPFIFIYPNYQHINRLDTNIHVIQGNLRFLIGLLALLALHPMIILLFNKLGFNIGSNNIPILCMQHIVSYWFHYCPLQNQLSNITSPIQLDRPGSKIFGKETQSCSSHY